MKRFLFALPLGWLAGCSAPSSPPPAPDASTECAAAIGLALGEQTQSTFMPFEDGQTVGVLLGFQGFRFINGAARLSGVDPQSDLAIFRFQVTFQSHDAIVQDRALPLPAGSESVKIVEDVQIFFNDIPMAELMEESPRLDAVVKVGECRGSQTLSLFLKDGGDCADIEPDGGGVCGNPADGGLGDAGP